MPTLPIRIGHLIPGVIVACCLVSASLSHAQMPPQKGGIYDKVQEAIDSKKYERSIPLPKQPTSTYFSEVGADGALLIGIQFALGRYDDELIIVGVKPVYGGSNGIWSTTTHGIYAKPTNPKTSLACSIVEYVSLMAPSGYAISKINLHRGRYVYGISLNYLPIGDRSLELKDSASSQFVGNQRGSKVVIDPAGLPVCGVCGHTTPDGILRDFGLIHIADPRLKPNSCDSSEEWAEEEFWNSLLDKKADPAPETPPEVASEEEPKAQTLWDYLPYLVFAGVALPIMLICYLLFGRQRNEDEPQVPVRLPGVARQSLDIRAAQGRFSLPELDLNLPPDDGSNSTSNGRGNTRWL